MSNYYNERLGRDMQFYAGRLGRNMGLGRKRGDRFIGLADVTNGYYNNLFALTLKEIGSSVAIGTIGAIAIKIGQGLLGM